jgi:hypothetical protein
MGITGATALALVGLSFVSLPALHALAEPHFIVLGTSP